MYCFPTFNPQIALPKRLAFLRLSGSKPNFSELARIYDVDRRTVKKYYDGYDGKPVHHEKTSKHQYDLS